MGANMMPTAKKRGRTVFGVRMGLMARFSNPFQCITHDNTHCHAFNRCCRKAVSRYNCQQAVVGGACWLGCLLGGRLLFCFCSSFLVSSWACIESACSMTVCDMSAEDYKQYETA